MTRIEYDLIRHQRPELGLRPWLILPLHWQRYALKLTPEQLIARRTGVLLAREYGEGRDDYTRTPEGLTK